MLPFPECLDLLDDAGTYSPTAVQILGLPPAAIRLLPDFSGHLAWLTGDPGSPTRSEPAFVFVIWDEALTETLTALLPTPGFRSIVVIFHRLDQTPPATLVGRSLVHFSFDGDPLDAVLGLVAPLVMPLVYRSVICVVLEDFEYLFARGGRLRCLGETRGEDLDVCLAELAYQLGETKRPAGGYKRLLTSMLLPSPFPAFSVVDRVLGMVGQYNTSAETSWLISTLVHQEATSRLCVYALEPPEL